MADVVTVTWGGIKISPVQYNTLDLDTFEMTTEVRPGETPEQAMNRAYAHLEVMAKKSYAKKLELFKEAYGQAKRIVVDDAAILPPPTEKDVALQKASEALMESLPKKRTTPVKMTKARIEEVKLQMLAMLREESFTRATAVHMVALWAWCHTETYQVAPALTAQEWSSAALLAGLLLRDSFSGKAERMVEFLRWSWAEEAKSRKWRLENGRSITPLGWRWQFGTKHVVKWRANGGGT